MPAMMDEQAYERYLRGKEDALQVLLERYRESLTLFLFGYVHNMEDAEELMLDAFAVVAAGESRYLEKSSFKTWLFGIGRNLARRHLRSQRLRSGIFRQLDDQDGMRDQPEALVLVRERDRMLYSAIEALPPDYRQTLYLLEIEGMSVEEAASIMGKTKKQLYNLAFRSRQALRTALSRMGIEDAQY